jgi:Domain of unknown function (DUF4129)
MIATKVDHRFGDIGGGKAWPLSLLVILLLGVTALASREPLRVPGTAHGAAPGGFAALTISPWQLVLVAAGGAMALIGVFAQLARGRRRPTDPIPARRPTKAPLLQQLVALLTLVLVGAVLVVGGLTGLHASGQVHRVSALPARVTSSGASAAGSRSSSTFEVPLWIPLSAVTLFLGGAALLLVSSRPSRQPEPELPAPKSVTPTIGRAIDRALERLDADPDPRLAVIAAYLRMEESLAAAGLPRRPAEAPREYAARAANMLEVDRQPLVLLTFLFERAKFSLHRFDAALRDQATGALRALREDLA